MSVRWSQRGQKMDLHVTTKDLQDQFHGRFCLQEHAQRMRCEIFCHFGVEMLNVSVTVCHTLYIQYCSWKLSWYKIFTDSFKMVSVHYVFLGDGHEWYSQTGRKKWSVNKISHPHHDKDTFDNPTNHLDKNTHTMWMMSFSQAWLTSLLPLVFHCHQ